MQVNPYTQHQELNLFWREPGRRLDYADADELRIKSILTAANDLSSLSEELNEAVTDWPLETNLSRQRHCLLRPLGITAADSVLELGSGCGAITRYLGETGATVTAVEGSYTRAEITAERCRELPNVSVIVDNIVDVQLDQKFDWVFLIGVLEYARLFVDGEDPIQTLLISASSHLNPGGRIVVAIENQLGLSFFNGRSEDHTGEPFFGINDLYSSQTVVTFGRRELSEKLKKTGLLSQQFIYPFPDYKMPRIMLTDEALDSDDFSAANLLYGMRSRDYYGRELELFDESFAYGVLERNGLIKDLAPSFMVIAAQDQVGKFDTSTLAWVYSVDNRKSHFACETVFTRIGGLQPEGEIEVRKGLLNEPTNTDLTDTPNSQFIHHPSPATPFIRGPLLAYKLSLDFARNPSRENIILGLLPWAKFCLENSLCTHGMDPKRLESWSMPENALESIPVNIIISSNGLMEIDREWSASERLPLSWILYRGMRSMHRPSVLARTLRIDSLFRDLCGELGLQVEKRDLILATQLEIAFRKTILDYEIPQPPDAPIRQSNWYSPSIYTIHSNAGLVN